MPKITTIDEAKTHLKANWKKPKGTTCPCCNQRVKLYTRKLNSSMAYALIIMYRNHKQRGNFTVYLKMNEIIANMKIPSSNIEYPKLAYWGLVEEMPKPDEKDTKTKTSGFWRLTSAGVLFVQGKIVVPRAAYVYNTTCYGHSDKKTTLKVALGDKFNYNELMTNVDA